MMVVWVAPRIVAGTVPAHADPKTAPQTVAFHPANSIGVISSFTAAEIGP